MKLRELTRADTAEVQAVYDRAEDYFVLVTGAPAPRAATGCASR